MSAFLFRASGVSKFFPRKEQRRSNSTHGDYSRGRVGEEPDIGEEEGVRILLRGAHIAVREREVVALVGPSGVGKSTFLRICAGRLRPDHVAGSKIPEVWREPEARLAWQPQEVPLIKTRNVQANVEIGALARGESGPSLQEISRRCLNLVRLDGASQLYPVMLSVGMKQRVALARTLAVLPKLVFLDEPLSSLDPRLRHEIAIELQDYAKAQRAGVALITHTIEEAIDFANRIYVLKGRPGRVALVAARSMDAVTDADRQEGAPIIVKESRGQLFEMVLEALTSDEVKVGQAKE